jgi:protein-S-isoprenylcysteine O-methyltransferase Ste14
MIFYVPIIFVVFSLLIFIPANDFTWLEGWLFIIIFLGYAFLYLLYSLVKDPDILMRRGKYFTDNPETQSFPDKTFMIIALVMFFFTFIFPGIEHAAEVSPLPWYVELIGFIGLIIGFVFITYVNKVNRYASKGLVIHKDHELITAGPYQFVRHPLYAGAIVMCISIPVALGSLLASVVALLWPILFAWRIRIEEEMLANHLPGYKEYMEQVKYRLIPRIY